VGFCQPQALSGTGLEGGGGGVQDQGRQKQGENTKEMKRLEKQGEVKMRERKKKILRKKMKR